VDDLIATIPTCIGVAIDPERPCDLTLRYAAFLAAWHGAELAVLTAGPVQGTAAAALEEVAGRLGELAAGLEPDNGRRGGRAYRLRPYGGEIRLARRSSTAAPASTSVPDALRASAAAEGVELLVVPRGVCWGGALFPLESVAERVSRSSPVPVLVAPETGAPIAVGPRPTIVVPALTADTASTCLGWAFSFSDRLDGRVAVVPAAGEERAVLARLRRALERLRPDLVVAPRLEREVGGTPALAHVLAGLVRSAPCPVLVVPPRVETSRPASRGSRPARASGDRSRGADAGSSPTSVRWHLRTARIERRPTDGRRVGR
jgi:nucleotide-binding universal stress UspA family protein